MNIFKFGGASLKNAAAVHNVAQIIEQNQSEKLLVVVSAMDKTTDALEQIAAKAFAKKDFQKEIDQLRVFHLEIARQLFNGNEFDGEIINWFELVEEAAYLEDEADCMYDQIVSFGELISSSIIAYFLQSKGIPTTWLDARKYIVTDSSFREAKVNWAVTQQKISELQKANHQLSITQGFIGANEKDETTTLGREGSDFTAAIFGSCMQAKSVTIWKDVPGVMSADPKRIASAIVFEELPYKEAAEMTYFGASVIHPKTIKPLANQNIPLLVKSFIDPTLAGTKIHECRVTKLPPLIVYKGNQCLISCKVMDYTFVDETQLAIIFKALTELSIRINVMQNSAISFSFCIDYRESKVLKLIEQLSKNFEVYYNANLTLITIKNYDVKTSQEYRNMKGVILEQSSRSTLQVLVKG